MARILLIDDDRDFTEFLGELLEKHGHEVNSTESAEDGLRTLSQRGVDPFDVVLLDNWMPRMHGLEFLEILRSRDIHLPVLLMTGHGTADIAIRASKLGAFKYLHKPDDLDHSARPLLELVSKAAEVAQAYHEPTLLSGNALGGSKEMLLGQSESMCKVYELIGSALRHEEPVLFTGETGTGKELAARALFDHSERSGKPFLKVNCKAFEEQRLADELFGYVADPVTFSDRRGRTSPDLTESPGQGRYPGVFEQADGGAVLLDNFTFMTRSLQAKILHLIREGTVLPGGRGTRPQPVNVRILACTNECLPHALEQGLLELEPELYYLLKQVEIPLPPLRERAEDIQLLANHFLLRSAAIERRAVRHFHENARSLLQCHPWPGNVRELQVVVRQAVLRCRGAHIFASHLSLDSSIPGQGARANGEECREPLTCPSDGLPTASKKPNLLSPSREKAYRLYYWALEVNPDLAQCSDEEIFCWLQNDARVDGEGLPRKRETFERYLREARAYHDDRKNTPRPGRPLGRSVVRVGQL